MDRFELIRLDGDIPELPDEPAAVSPEQNLGESSGEFRDAIPQHGCDNSAVWQFHLIHHNQGIDTREDSFEFRGNPIND